MSHTEFSMVAEQSEVEPTALRIYNKLAQYPLLSNEIRRQMREALFAEGKVTNEAYEREIQRRVFDSRISEGHYDPAIRETATDARIRRARIERNYTDNLFAEHHSFTAFMELVIAVVEARSQRAVVEKRFSFNPEIEPKEKSFRVGEAYEQLPPPERKVYEHHLEEIKVALIREIITDQLELVRVAKGALSIADLRRIDNRRIGEGKIGGKAAGMLIAWKLLQQQDPTYGADISTVIGIPESYYLGTNVMYEFRHHNALEDRMNQKYKSLDEIRQEHPLIVQEHLDGTMPQWVVDELRAVLQQLGNRPVIVRSSSLLEDNFKTAFAGKYESHFCPNQGTAQENLEALITAIKRVYASTLNPDALLYRKRHRLLDFDERMAILIQEVKGEQFGRYFFPTLAGVGFSENPFRWHRSIRSDDGFLRMVWGLGTRAVDRVSADYPRLIALSHPTLRPESNAQKIRQYSQRYIDLIDLQTNTMQSLPVGDVLTSNYKYLRYIASDYSNGHKRDISPLRKYDPDDLVLTLDGMTENNAFGRLMRTALMRLEQAYESPVDIEFALEIVPRYGHPEIHLSLLQCRPLSQRAELGKITIPRDLPDKSILFTEYDLVPNGKVEGVRYAVFVDPEAYTQIPTRAQKLEVARAVGRLNKQLEGESFILMGPGRWGSSNIDLGVKVTYADIFNAKVLIEIAAERGDGGKPELSYGTHFFQDLVEAGIYSLPLHLNRDESRLDWHFFRTMPNLLTRFSPRDEALSSYVRVIDIASCAAGQRLNILMNSDTEEAVGFLSDGDWQKGGKVEDSRVAVP